MLYHPEAFDPLTERPWDEGWVRDEIARIVADASGAYAPQTLWPAEEWDSWQTPTPLKALYVGGAGVVWALGALERRGHAESALDLAGAAHSVLEAWRAEPDFMRGTELPSPPAPGSSPARPASSPSRGSSRRTTRSRTRSSSES